LLFYGFARRSPQPNEMHMGPNEIKDLYRRWLLEVWGTGSLELSQELIDENIVDHNPYRGQPEGRSGRSPWSGRPFLTSVSPKT
jgi:hypothetical protein